MAIFITKEEADEMNNIERGIKNVQVLEYKGKLFRYQTEVEEYIQKELVSKVQEYIFHPEEHDCPSIGVNDLVFLFQSYDRDSVIEALKECQ